MDIITTYICSLTGLFICLEKYSEDSDSHFLNNFQTARHILEKLPQHEVLILKDKLNREQCKAAELQQQQLD